jgi:hypothetical protein
VEHRDTLLPHLVIFFFFAFSSPSRLIHTIRECAGRRQMRQAAASFLLLLGILTRSCSVERWRSARRSHVEVAAIRNRSVHEPLLSYRRRGASLHRPSWLLNRPFFISLSFCCELTPAGATEFAGEAGLDLTVTTTDFRAEFEG